VLALVVGGAAAVEPVAVALQHPGIQAGLPARFLSADHIAVAVRQDRDQRRILDALSDEEGSMVAGRVVEDPAVKAELLETRLHLPGEIAGKLGAARGILAFGGNGDAAREVGEKPALVEVPLGMRNCAFPAHRLVDYLR